VKQNVSVIIGAQWGDEGKGKWVDILAAKADIVARFQGGNNAGHTLYVDGQKVVLHQIPSGIFQKKVSVLSAGVVVNPVGLVKEIRHVESLGFKISPENFWLSPRSHVITPWTEEIDKQGEHSRKVPIGTTKRGIGPTYGEKVMRTGLRLGEYLNPETAREWFESMSRENPAFAAWSKDHPDVWEEFWAQQSYLRTYLCDAEHHLRQAIKADKEVLLEGAQGALLDIDHGTYPFVTSSHTGLGGAITGIGFSPAHLGKVVGVSKAYTTRVGNGPFPTEQDNAVGESLAGKGKEFGATTGRRRRCGWLDAVALRYSCDVSGFTDVVLNKLDILTGFDEIKVCRAYKLDGKEVDHFPWDLTLKNYEPVYETFPGWTEDLSNCRSLNDLPQGARSYIKEVEKLVGTRVSMVGVGVGRADGIFI
jgi:adenylosuccinate synthase